MTTSNRLPQARHTVIVNDGTTRWASSRAEVYAWLHRHGIGRGFDRSTNLSNVAHLTEDQYDDLCRKVSFYEVTHEQIQILEDRGAEELHIY